MFGRHTHNHSGVHAYTHTHITQYIILYALEQADTDTAVDTDAYYTFENAFVGAWLGRVVLRGQWWKPVPRALPSGNIRRSTTSARDKTSSAWRRRRRCRPYTLRYNHGAHGSHICGGKITKRNNHVNWRGPGRCETMDIRSQIIIRPELMQNLVWKSRITIYVHYNSDELRKWTIFLQELHDLLDFYSITSGHTRI